jgi:hypothetical protein
MPPTDNWRETGASPPHQVDRHLSYTEFNEDLICDCFPGNIGPADLHEVKMRKLTVTLMAIVDSKPSLPSHPTP